MVGHGIDGGVADYVASSGSGYGHDVSESMNNMLMKSGEIPFCDEETVTDISWLW